MSAIDGSTAIVGWGRIGERRRRAPNAGVIV
jgi:hypothetical protein